MVVSLTINFYQTAGFPELVALPHNINCFKYHALIHYDVPLYCLILIKIKVTGFLELAIMQIRIHVPDVDPGLIFHDFSLVSDFICTYRGYTLRT